MFIKFIILSNLVSQVILRNMEKRKPHYNLKEIKRVIRDPNSHPFTASARHGGIELGLTPHEMKEVVLCAVSIRFFQVNDHNVPITGFGKMSIMARLHQAVPYISRSQVTLMVGLL